MAAAAWSGAWAPAVIHGEAPCGRRKQAASSMAWMHGATPSMLKWKLCRGRLPARCVDHGSRSTRFSGIAYAMEASFGGAGEFSGPTPVFPRIDVRDPYRRLGISREASEEEVREARNYLLKQYGAHSKSKAAIESAYDKIILDSLKQRRRPKPKRISERPAWVRKVYDRFDVPPTIVIAARAFAFILLGVWSVFDSAAEGPVIQVILSLAACIYFLKKRFKALWKASLIGIGLVLSSQVENPVGSSSHAQDSSHIKKQRKRGLVSAGQACVQKAALKWLGKQRGLSRPVSERLSAPEQLAQQFAAGTSDPSPKKKRSLLQKAKCGFKTDQRSSKKFRELLRPHGSSPGTFRRKAAITAEAHEGENSKNLWPVLKRPKWHLFGGSAVIGAGIVALAMAKSQPGKSTRSFSGAGSNSGDCGQGGSAGNGVGGGGGGGGDGGGGGPKGGGYDPGIVSGSREEEAQQSKHAQPTYVLASMSSSKYDSLEQEFRKVRNKMGSTIPATVASANDVVQGDTDETVELFKGKAYINFENSKLNVELVREKAEKSQLAREQSDQSEAVTNLDTTTSQENVPFEEASSSSTRQNPATVVEDNSLRRDEGKDRRLNWLSGIVDSALLKAGAKTRVLEEKERKELAEDVAALVLQQLGGDDGLAKSSETGALKRLQREAFADIMKVRERLDKLDLSLPELKRVADSVGIAKTRLKGRVAAGGAFVLMQDISSYSSRSALEQVGLPAGLDVDFTFETPFRDMDLLTTKCVAGQANFDSSTLGGPIRLEKLSYAAQVTDDVKFSFVPLGAEAKDVTDIVNPVQDQALTKFASSGPALFGHCKGSAIGATYRSLSALMSVSEYLSGWGDSNGPLCLATLAQFIYQPSDHLILSLSGLNRFWPSPPLPSSAGLHWSEMRPFVLSKSTRSSSSALGTVRASDSSSFSRMLSSGEQWSPETPPFEPKGTAMQSLAVSGEVDLGGFASMGGWVQVERGDWLQDDEKRRLQWSLSIAKPTGNVVHWGVSIGSSRRDYWSTSKDEEANLTDLTGKQTDCSPSQLQVEAFVRCDCGQGFSLQPGMLYILNKHYQTPALLIKAEWGL